MDISHLMRYFTMQINPASITLCNMHVHVYAYIHILAYTNTYCTYIYSVKTLTVASWISNSLHDFALFIIARKGLEEIWHNVMFTMSWKISPYMY